MPDSCIPAPHSLQRLRAEAASYPADPFLLTVTASGAPHCSPVPVEWAGDQLIVPAPRAVLHRRGRAADAGTIPGCGSDCIPVIPAS